MSYHHRHRPSLGGALLAAAAFSNAVMAYSESIRAGLVAMSLGLATVLVMDLFYPFARRCLGCRRRDREIEALRHALTVDDYRRLSS